MTDVRITDALKRFAPLIFGVAGAAIGSASGFELPPWAVDSLRQWGPGATVILFLLLWYVPRDAVEKFIGAQQAQAVAMQKVGDQLAVMTGHAGKLDEISEKLDDIKFNSDVFGDRLTRIEERFIDAQRQDHLQP